MSFFELVETAEIHEALLLRIAENAQVIELRISRIDLYL
jgi:hypothetical protein